MWQKVLLKPALLSALIVVGSGLLPIVAEARRPLPRPTGAQTSNVAGQFAYYALALSWSPDYCAAKGSSDPQQCGGNRQLGFVLHGLWPQYDRGFPESCTTEAFEPKIVQQFPALYPSTKLYIHEWSKHGTCSGLTQPQYHQLAKTLKDGIKIPDRYQRPSQPFRVTLAKFKQDFVQANPSFTENNIAPTCSGSGRFLQEMQVGYAKNGQPQALSQSVLKRSQKSCGQPNFLIRSVR